MCMPFCAVCTRCTYCAIHDLISIEGFKWMGSNRRNFEYWRSRLIAMERMRRIGYFKLNQLSENMHFSWEVSTYDVQGIQFMQSMECVLPIPLIVVKRIDDNCAFVFAPCTPEIWQGVCVCVCCVHFVSGS